MRKRCLLACLIAGSSVLGCDDRTDPVAAAQSAKKSAAKAAAKMVIDERPPDPETGIIAKPSFALRSPLSSPKVIAERFGLSAVPIDDYKLSDFHFLEFIPPLYDPKKPIGILVLVNYKPSDGLPNAILPQVSAANMAFVVAQELPDTAWKRAGLALDAVYNIQKEYAVDPRRIYIMGGGSLGGGAPAPLEATAVPQWLGLAFPDVFTGTIAHNAYPYRPTRSPSGGFYKPVINKPPAPFFALAKEHPLIISPFDADPSFEPLIAAYKADGFKHVEMRAAVSGQYHYPFYTDTWLPGMIEYLDAHTKNLPLSTTKPATTKPTSKP